MQDYTLKRLQIDKLVFMNGCILFNVDAYINYNFLITPAPTEDKTTWINLNSIYKMEGTQIIEDN